MKPTYVTDGPFPRLGPGVSRASAQDKAFTFQVAVRCPGAPLMRLTIPAPTRAKAIEYCKNRWPLCSVEVLP